MQENVGETMELDHVAREVGLSRPHFFKLFRTQVGLTPNLYANALRMERAIERLAGDGRGGGRHRLRPRLLEPGEFLALLHRERRRPAVGLPPVGPRRLTGRPRALFITPSVRFHPYGNHTRSIRNPYPRFPTSFQRVNPDSPPHAPGTISRPPAQGSDSRVSPRAAPHATVFPSTGRAPSGAGMPGRAGVRQTPSGLVSDHRDPSSRCSCG